MNAYVAAVSTSVSTTCLPAGSKTTAKKSGVPKSGQEEHARAAGKVELAEDPPAEVERQHEAPRSSPNVIEISSNVTWKVAGWKPKTTPRAFPTRKNGAFQSALPNW